VVGRREGRPGGCSGQVMLMAAGHSGHRQLHGGVEFGDGVRSGGVEVEGRLPWEGVRHRTREL